MGVGKPTAGVVVAVGSELVAVGSEEEPTFGGDPLAPFAGGDAVPGVKEATPLPAAAGELAGDPEAAGDWLPDDGDGTGSVCFGTDASGLNGETVDVDGLLAGSDTRVVRSLTAVAGAGVEVALFVGLTATVVAGVSCEAPVATLAAVGAAGVDVVGAGPGTASRGETVLVDAPVDSTLVS